MQSDVHFLQNVAALFRENFEQQDLSKTQGFLPHFPDGCCNWATYMIGHFLKYERNMAPLEVVGRRIDEDGSTHHSWVSIAGLTIDITSDQFSDSNSSVIVSKSSEWHQKWKIVEKNDILKIQHYDIIEEVGLLRPSIVYELLAVEVRRNLMNYDL